MENLTITSQSGYELTVISVSTAAAKPPTGGELHAIEGIVTGLDTGTRIASLSCISQIA